MKLPVLATARESIDYFRRNFRDLVRVAWLPLLTLEFASAGYKVFLYDAVPKIPDVVAFWSALRVVLGPLIWLVLIPIAAVGITRPILRNEDWPSGAAYIGYGADEVRLAKTTAILLAMIAVGIIVFGFVTFIVMFEINKLGNAPYLLGILAALIFLAELWLFLRLSLTYVAAIAERKLGIQSSWHKTNGNVWSLALLYAPLGLLLFGASDLDLGLLGNNAWMSIIRAVLGEPRAPELAVYAVLSVAFQFVLSIAVYVFAAVAYLKLTGVEGSNAEEAV